jgi:hypothetical protein
MSREVPSKAEVGSEPWATLPATTLLVGLQVASCAGGPFVLNVVANTLGGTPDWVRPWMANHGDAYVALLFSSGALLWSFGMGLRGQSARARMRSAAQGAIVTASLFLGMAFINFYRCREWERALHVLVPLPLFVAASALAVAIPIVCSRTIATMKAIRG